MAKGFNIRAWLGLETKGFSQGLKKAQGKLTGFQKTLRGTNDVLRGLKFAAIGVTGVGAFTRAITTLKTFQTNMARVKVISQATNKQMEKMTALARDLGATTRFSASEAASGLQFLTMAGLSANEAMIALPETLNLAGAAMVDVGYAADVATNILGGFGLEVEELKRVTDVMSHTTRSSNTNLIELYEGMKEAAPLANNLGIEIEEVAQAMALYANAGIKGQRAGVSFSGVLARLLRSPKMVSEALGNLGVVITETSIRQEGFIGTIKRMNAAGVTATDMARIFGLHVKTAGIFANKTAEEIDSMSGRLKDSENAAKNMSEDGIGAIDKAVKLLKSALDELFISFGYENGFAGLVESVLVTLRKLIIAFTNTSKSMKLFIIATVLFLSKGRMLITVFSTMVRLTLSLPAALRLATINLKSFGRAINASLGPIGWMALAIEGLILAFDVFGSSGEQALHKIKKSFDNFDELKNLSLDEVKGLTDGEIKKAYKEIQTEHNRLVEKIKNEQNYRKDWTDDQIEWAKNEVKTYKEKAGLLTKELGLRKDLKDNAKRIAQSERDAIKNEVARKKAAEGKAEAAEAFLKYLVDQNKEHSKFISELDTGQYRYWLDQLLEMSEVMAVLKKEMEMETSPLNPLLSDMDLLIQKFKEGTYNLGKFAPLAAKAFETVANQAALGSESFEDFGNSIRDASLTAIDSLIATAIATWLAQMAIEGPLGLILGVLGAGLITTAVRSAIPKFAGGGIVPGQNMMGDRVHTMLNSGEMVLNQAQQSNLFKAISGGGFGGGRVEFEIRADRLVGVLNNYNQKNGRFR